MEGERERGQAYSGPLVLVATLLAAIVLTAAASRVAGGWDESICQFLGSDGCSSSPEEKRR